MHLQARWALRFSLMSCLPLGSACLTPNLDHCANNGTVCGQGFVCDACAWKNDGCVTELEASASAECRVSAGGADTLGGETQGDASSTRGDMPTDGSPGMSTSSSDSGDDSSGAQLCQAEDQLDEACGEAQPYCSQGECVACFERTDLCAAIPGGLLACDDDTGRCVECTAEQTQACTGTTPVCGADASCRACTSHGECPQSACRIATGACFPAEHVYAVDAAATCGGDGSDAAPFCSLEEAENALISTPVYTLRLAAGYYELQETFDVGSGKQVAVTGEGLVRLHENPGVYSQVGVRASPGAELYLSSLRIEDFFTRNVECNGAAIFFDEVRSTGSNGHGLVAYSCDTTIRRSQVHDNDAGGLNIQGTSLRLENTFITGNGATSSDVAGIDIDGAQVEIVYSTIAGNYPTLIGIGCGPGTTGSIRNSIVVGHGDDTLECGPTSVEVSRSAVEDSGFADAGDNLIIAQADIPFVALALGDAHLSSAAALEDVARWQTGDPVHDIDGDERPTTPGAADIAGADRP